MSKKVSSESVVKDIRRKTRKKYSSEEKIRIVLDGLRGEDSIANLCRREGIPANLYYRFKRLTNLKAFLLLAIRSHSCRALFESKRIVLLDISQQVVITFEVFRETVILSCIFTVFRAVFAADVRPSFVDAALVFLGQKSKVGPSL